MRALVEELCSADCAGRAPGTRGGRTAREIVRRAFEEVGLEVHEQPIPAIGGANLYGMIPGSTPGWILIGAHYDHLGQLDGDTFHGADDNAAAIAILVELARAFVAKPSEGKGLIVAAFDAEEPPYFLSDAMGSEHFAQNPPVPLDQISLMVCMDLVGHAVGDASLPPSIRDTVFALGAERSDPTRRLVDELSEAVEGVRVRRIDAETVPPLSDYWAFWRRRIPFLFLTNGRWRHYHTPQDTPERLDYAKMAATACWLEAFARAAANVTLQFTGRRDDASTLRTVLDLLEVLGEGRTLKRMRGTVERLLARCDADGRAPEMAREEIAGLVGMIEAALA